jgi:hypothetical protein
MRAFKLIIGILLCIMGFVLILFEIGTAFSERLPRDAVLPFAIFLVSGVIVFTGGILLCKG